MKKRQPILVLGCRHAGTDGVNCVVTISQGSSKGSTKMPVEFKNENLPKLLPDSSWGLILSRKQSGLQISEPW
jgi:hypothetical protein